MIRKWPQLRKCNLCGIDFYAKGNYPEQRFCSITCGNKARFNKPYPYTVETFCKCGCGQMFLNPDDHYRYRKFVPEHRNANGTHPRIGKKESDEHVEMRIKSVLKSFRNKVPTCIEKELYEFLTKNNIQFISQKQIGRTIVDAYIPETKLCIYADGFYWHSKPEIIERDKRINENLIVAGYNVLRLNSINNGYKLDLEPLKLLLDSFSGARV